MKTTGLIAAIAVIGGSAASAGAVMVPVAAQPMAAAPQISAVFELYGGIGTYANMTGNASDLEDLDGNPSLFGGSARVSIPWTHSFSTQLDLDAGNAAIMDDEEQYVSSTIGTLHASYRGSDSWMLGAFVGGGTANTEDEDTGLLKFAGVEGQYFFNNFTLYAQIGYLDSIETDGDYSDTFHAASFVRGVGRYFINDKTMVQAEVAYATGKQDTSPGSGFDMEIISYGVRAQREFDLGNVPLTIFAAYEGAQYSNGTEGDNGEFTENNFLAGVQFRFGTSSMIENDRHGASLSTPNFGRWVAAGETID